MPDVNPPVTLYTLTFDANGGSGAPDPIQRTSGSSGAAVVPSQAPWRTGCSFLGWNTKADGTGTHYSGGDQITVHSDFTLYAVWIGAQVTSITAYRSTSGGTKSPTGTYGHVVASSKAISTVAGTVSVTAKWGTAGSTPATSLTLSNASYAKTATADASATHAATFGGSFAESGSYVVQVTAKLSVPYNGTTYTAQFQASAVVPKATVTFSALAGGNGIAIGTAATVASAFEVGWRAIQSATSLGWWLVDRLGQRYAGIRDNGTNLWIGASTSTGDHHMGKTYISAGLDYDTYLAEGSDWKASGNPTAYVSVPTRAGSGSITQVSYPIWHAGNHGTVVQSEVSTAVSVATATNKSITYVQLPAGTWLLIYGVRFATNATGRREAVLGTTADAIDGTWQRRGGEQTPAASGGATMLSGAYVHTTTGSSTLVYLTVYQNSGGALDVTGELQAVKVG